MSPGSLSLLSMTELFHKTGVTLMVEGGGLDLDYSDNYDPPFLPPTPPVVVDEQCHRHVAEPTDCSRKEMKDDHLEKNEDEGYSALSSTLTNGLRLGLAAAITLALDGKVADACDRINAVKDTIVAYPKEIMKPFEATWCHLYMTARILILGICVSLGDRQTTRTKWLCPGCYKYIKLGKSLDLNRWHCDGCFIDTTQVERAFLLTKSCPISSKALSEAIKLGLLTTF